MTQVRYLFLIMCGWLFLLYNVERLIAPIDIASFTYILTMLVIIVLILLPKLYQFAFHWLLLAVLVPFFTLKILLSYEIAGGNLPITITEISVLSLTIVLAQLTRHRFENLQEALANLTIGRPDEDVHSFGTGQGQIYREIRRARRHQRPAALLAISVPETSAHPAQNRFLENAPLRSFLEEVQREMLKKYVSTRIANLLVSELGDLAVITQRNDHFVTLLPETDRESLREIVNRLQGVAQENLGLHFKIGMSTFPEEALTFETMLERAEAAMENGEQADDTIPLQRSPADTTGIRVP